MTRRQRVAFATSLVVSLGVVALSLPTSLFAAAPTFGQPTISGIQGVGFEEDIRRFTDLYRPQNIGMRIVAASVLRSHESLEDDLALAAASARGR